MIGDNYQLSERAKSFIATQGGRVSLTPIVLPSDSSEINLPKYLGAVPPARPSYFSRCIKTLDAIPGLRGRLHEMKAVSKPWEIFVDHWNEFEHLLNMDPTNNRKAECNDRMREVMVGDKLIKWLEESTHGSVATSFITGLTGFNVNGVWQFNSPLYASEFASCVKILKLRPDFRSRLSDLKHLSPCWKKVVEHWDELESLLERERGNNGYPLYDSDSKRNFPELTLRLLDMQAGRVMWH